jgi:hypothetical protein
VIIERYIGNYLEGNDRVPVLRYIPAFARRDCGKPRKLQSEYSVSRPRFEPRTSRIRIRSFISSVRTLPYYSLYAIDNKLKR